MRALAVVALAGLLGAGSALAAGLSYARTLGEGDPRPLVVTSITVLADLVRQVGGERVRVHSLLGPGQDPHTYEPVPRDALAISRARLVVLNGYDLDFWAERLVEGASPRPPVVKLAEGVPEPPLPWPGEGKRGDPHMWMDPVLAIHYVEQIAEALARLDPEGAAYYRQRSQAYIQELRRLDGWIAAQVATIPTQRRQAGVRIGGQLYADALGPPGSGADTYVGMMEHNVRTIVGALREGS